MKAESDFNATLERLRNNDPTLTEYNSHGNMISVEEIRALADALKTNTTLTTLILIDSGIGNEGAEALADALKTNKSLRELRINNDKYFRDEEISSLSKMILNEGAKKLAEALEINTSLLSLDLRSNLITDEVSKEKINSLIERNKRIYELTPKAKAFTEGAAMGFFAEIAKSNQGLPETPVEIAVHTSTFLPPAEGAKLTLVNKAIHATAKGAIAHFNEPNKDIGAGEEKEKSGHKRKWEETEEEPAAEKIGEEEQKETWAARVRSEAIIDTSQGSGQEQPQLPAPPPSPGRWL